MFKIDQVLFLLVFYPPGTPFGATDLLTSDLGFVTLKFTQKYFIQILTFIERYYASMLSIVIHCYPSLSIR